MQSSSMGDELFSAFELVFSSWERDDKQYWYVDKNSKCVYIIWGD